MARSVPGGPVARTQLRIKVLAGVVAVTLFALAAFGIVAVTTMRDYLYGQTRAQLVTEAEQAGQELSTLNVAAADANDPRSEGNRSPGEITNRFGIVAESAGQFDIVWLRASGKPLAFEVALIDNHGLVVPSAVTVASTIARTVTKAGFSTARVAGEPTLLYGVRIGGSGLVVAGTPLAQVASTVSRIERIVVIGSAAVILIIGAGVFLVLRRGLRPIEAMAARADRITAGDLADRIAPHNPGSEVGRLGAALNGMLARIEADVQEREAGQERMRQFFADASHELRTPLASLLANVELHQHGVLTEPAQVTEVMRRMALETQRMGRLVDDMLRLARLGQHPVQGRELLDLTVVVAGCAQRARITDPGRCWQVDVADGLEITGDEELLRRAIDNLCANVLVHTPRDTVATITATANDGRVRIEISDDGPGVAADKLPRIFERFYRAGAGASRPGSGLGLAIVMETAAAHGGTAEAAPAPPHGLRITLTLPVEQPTPAASATPSAHSTSSSPVTSPSSSRLTVSMARTSTTKTRCVTPSTSAIMSPSNSATPATAPQASRSLSGCLST